MNSVTAAALKIVAAACLGWMLVSCGGGDAVEADAAAYRASEQAADAAAFELAKDGVDQQIAVVDYEQDRCYVLYDNRELPVAISCVAKGAL